MQLPALIGLLAAISLQAQQSFVPDDFNVPEVFEHEKFRIRVLTVNDVIKDYDAVMSSRAHLQGVFGPESTWPSEDLSLEQDLIDLGWHQKEFQIRSSFTYTVVRPDESEVIGCLYIYPTSRGDYDSCAFMWVRESVLNEGLDALLYETVKSWLAEDWPLKQVAYPGRSLSFEAWDALK